MAHPQRLDPLNTGQPPLTPPASVALGNIKETITGDLKRMSEDFSPDTKNQYPKVSTGAEEPIRIPNTGRAKCFRVACNLPQTGERVRLCLLPYSVIDMPKDRGEPAPKQPRSLATTKSILQELREIFEAMQTPSSFEVNKRGTLPPKSFSPPTGLLDCPGELVDIIAQYLPRNSFLDLRATCKDMKEKTTYHFERRHVQEKRLALGGSRAGLHSLVEIASQPSFAKRVHKVVVEGGNLNTLVVLKARQSLGRECGTLCPELCFHDCTLDLGVLVVDSRTVDFGLFIASLATLPALEVVEITDETRKTKDLLDRPPLFDDRAAARFMNKERCFRCKQSATAGRCVHLTMLSKALLGLTLDAKPNVPPNQPVQPFQSLLSLGQRLGMLPVVEEEDFNPLLPHSLHSLREIHFRASPISLYNS
ncbi:uncharacterized protein BDZ99DRAFT_470754 [Mytilinidion resinicola]|uniref:F-box domain-containing protein n=1 Tax=Mytilinidion resinicola TaxID=574789 RepID=A0A6A6Z9U2_9PEZI|nr:uncharacterized protein BDZ99DRAFT_470754 [Mytilinidion resinicola]KAF2817800.1 hypothetical protein BDZ99DRAFT_470754 [Mytilinidion resinicola]